MLKVNFIPLRSCCSSSDSLISKLLSLVVSFVVKKAESLNCHECIYFWKLADDSQKTCQGR